MPSNSFTLLSLLSLVLFLFASLATAVDVFGSNSTLPKQASQLILVWQGPGLVLNPNPMIEPLTVDAGKDTSALNLDGISIKGNFKTVNMTTAGSVNKDDIALVSCDPSSSFLSPNDVIDLIVPKVPLAIVLYSLASRHCGINAVGEYQLYFTLQNMTANTIRVFASMPLAKAIILTDGSDSKEQTEQQARNQTPAVAMSVLYAVTGIVTVLFLAIITTGAWRAHNNPARYGPRHGLPGRPRQSRARGLAKAMLETLPIVKFGDPLPSKAEHRDIELEAVNAAEAPTATAANMAATTEQKAGPQPDVVPAAASAATDSADVPLKPDEPVAAPPPDDEAANDNLGCSICTEDFTKGENVRVLPCNHQYHPACIDPWLLNVSGTCPLCRVDLRPVRSNSTALSSRSSADRTSLPPAGTLQHSRVQRILATRHAPVQERIAILRQLAREAGHHQGHHHHHHRQQQQQQQQQGQAAPAGELGGWSRLRYTVANRLFSARPRAGIRSGSGAPQSGGNAASADMTAPRSDGGAAPANATTPALGSVTEGDTSRP